MAAERAAPEAVTTADALRSGGPDSAVVLLNVGELRTFVTATRHNATGLGYAAGYKAGKASVLNAIITGITNMANA